MATTGRAHLVLALVALLPVALASHVAAGRTRAPIRRVALAHAPRAPIVLATPGEGEQEQARRASTYTPKQLLREEIESPFRKVRQTLAGFSAVSASVATVIAGSRAAACAFGGVCLQPLEEVLPNLAINIGVIGAAATSFWWDARAQRSKLARIARGGELAALQLTRAPSLAGGAPANLPMSALRKETRVVIVAGGPDVYTAAVESARGCAQLLVDNEIVVVPILLDAQTAAVDPSGSAGGALATELEMLGEATADSPFALTRGPAAWDSWLRTEVATARKQGFDAAALGLTLAVKKSGKIARRSTRVPNWREFAEELALADRNFGMPDFGSASSGPQSDAK